MRKVLTLVDKFEGKVDTIQVDFDAVDGYVFPVSVTISEPEIGITQVCLTREQALQLRDFLFECYPVPTS